MNTIKIICFIISFLLIFSCKKENLSDPVFSSPQQGDLKLTLISSGSPEASGAPAELQIETGPTVLASSQATINIVGQGTFTNGQTTLTTEIGQNDVFVFNIYSRDIGEAIISVEVSGLSESIEIQFIKATNAFDLTSTASSPIEHIIKTTITDSNLLQSSDSVSFTTTVGHFANGTKAIKVPIDFDACAVVQISHTEPGQAFVTAKVGIYTKTIDLLFTLPTELITFDVGDTVPADNFSEIEIKAKVNGISLTNEMIVFNTNRGTFQDGNTTMSIPILVDSTASVYLKHTLGENAVITATLLGQTYQTVAVFNHAWPDVVLVEPAQSTVSNMPGSVAEVSAKLFRTMGTASPGTIISWSDSTSTGISPGIFLNSLPSDMSGLATTEYHLQDTLFSGYTYLIATIDSPLGIVKNYNRIFVTN